MMKIDKLGKRKYFNFIFFVLFNILTANIIPWKLCLELKFCGFYILHGNILFFFFFFLLHCKFCYFFIFFFFCFQTFQVYTFWLTYHFLINLSFSKFIFRLGSHLYMPPSVYPSVCCAPNLKNYTLSDRDFWYTCNVQSSYANGLQEYIWICLIIFKYFISILQLQFCLYFPIKAEVK